MTLNKKYTELTVKQLLKVKEFKVSKKKKYFSQKQIFMTL